MDIESIIKMKDSLCECEAGIVCPTCKLIQTVEEQQSELDLIKPLYKEHLEEVRLSRKAVEEYRVSQKRYLETLNFYHHKIKKNCPCQLEGKHHGKCESPWTNEGERNVRI